MQQNNVDRDYLETLTRRIEALEQQVAQMRNNMKPTVPIYDSTNFPQNPVEGQIALGTDGQAYKYQDGVWSPLGGGIKYDFDNMGDWLYVEASGSDDVHGYAIEFEDDGVGGNGIGLRSTNGFVEGVAAGVGFTATDKRVDLAAISAPVTIFGATTDDLTPAAIYLKTVDGEDIFLEAGAGIHLATMRAEASGTFGSFIYCGAGEITMVLEGVGDVDQAFLVGDGVTGHFIVRHNGRVHMSSLPTSDPASHDGQLWNDSGTIKIST